MNRNPTNGRVAAWQAFVRMQAIVTYPQHLHWQEQAWAAYAHDISGGFQDLFTLTEPEREQAEDLFCTTIIRLQALEHETQIALN